MREENGEHVFRMSLTPVGEIVHFKVHERFADFLECFKTNPFIRPHNLPHFLWLHSTSIFLILYFHANFVILWVKANLEKMIQTWTQTITDLPVLQSIVKE